MTRKVFISYASEDNGKMKILRGLIEKKFKKNKFEIIIVADRKDPGQPLTIKVMNGLKESSIFIPILTTNSINNQWVNQEIGFAMALNEIAKKGNDKMQLLPIVDNALLDSLRGFIHRQVDLPFTFTANSLNPRKERLSYKKCCENVLYHLQNLVSKKTGVNKQKQDIVKEIKNTFLRQKVDYESLLSYANKNYSDFRHDDHNINKLLWRDLDKNKYKTLKDIDAAVKKAKPAVDAYYYANRSMFESGTDFLTKSLGFVDLDFRQKHPFSSQTRNAFAKYSSLIKR